MEYVVDLIAVLAWPLTVLLLFWWVREPIRRIFPLIRRIKFKDLEIELSERLKQVKEDVGKVAQFGQDLNKDDLRVYALIENSPASAVIEAWRFLENSARNKVKQLLPADEAYRDPLRRPIDYLDYTGALVPSTASAARDLRALRNEVAHADSDAISREDAIQYAELAASIRRQIEIITELPKVKLTALTRLILELNHLIDSKKFDDVTIAEVYGWIEKQDILPSLAKRTAGESDLSSYGDDGPYANFTTFYHDQMNCLAGGYAGDHGRKWGVENLGLCLLLAWTNELIQLGAGWHPDEM